MTTTSNSAPLPPSAAPTTAGNYFVSNYPPYGFWKPERVPELESALSRPPGTGVPLGLYVHIPFCRKRCHFCYFKVYTDKDAAQIRRYVAALLRELDGYASRSALAGRYPEFVYFGGGTPSYLSVDQLRQLADGLKRALSWEAVEEVTFECEPGTLTGNKLEAIRDLGVTRLSLGVEHFDDHVLEINGRAHLSKEIRRAYKQARALSFPQINIDLIAGMLDETESRWRDCVRQAIDLAPDSITIYEMEIPFNTTIYQRMKTDGHQIAPVADWDTKRAWVAYAFAELERCGYTVASAYTAVKDPARARFLYRDRLWTGADLLGLGVASFGHLNGTHYQNHHDFGPYLEKVESGLSPVYRALTPTGEERFIREFILQLKLGRVDLGYFRDKFGVEAAARFSEPLAELRRAELAEVEDDMLRLSRPALLQVDRLLRAFFLPQHREGRYA